MRLSSKSWNQGRLDRNPFAMRRERAIHRVPIDAPVDDLFERACLAGQPVWLPAGSLRLSDSESGRDDKDALWSETETGSALFGRPELQTFWTTTELDPARHRYQAVLINPELAVGTLDVAMDARDVGTVVRFELSYTVLSEAGSALFDEGIGERLNQLLERFGQTLANSLTAEPSQVIAAPHPAQRQSVEHQILISGDIDECFALACPVAELLWIDDWKFDLVYSESGKNETGCVFLEPSTGLSILRAPGADTYWYTTRFDTEQHRFDAIWLTRDLTIARWELQMTDLGDRHTRVDWRLTYTGLGPKGNRIVAEKGLDRRMKAALSFLATALQHYVETGSIYRISSQRKVQIAASLVGAALGRHFRDLRADDGGASAPSK